MKKNSFPLITLIIIAVFTITGCSKKDSNGGVAVTKDNLVGSYTVTAFTISVPPVTINALDSLLPCERDDIYKLRHRPHL